MALTGGHNEASVYHGEDCSDEGDRKDSDKDDVGDEEEGGSEAGRLRSIEERLGLKRKRGFWLLFEVAMCAIMVASM